LAWSAVALVLAVLTLRYVEEPVRRGELFGERSDSWINLAALGATAAAALLTVAALGAARSSTASPIQRRIAAARQDAMSHDCWGSLLENAKGKCEFGDLRASTSAVLLGDSHAEHWLAGMDRVGAARGWKVTAMIKPGCPVADVPQLMNTRLKRYYTECTEWRRSMLRRIIAMHPSFVVLSSFDHYVSPSDP